MSWIERIWGHNKDDQFKGIILIFAALFVALAPTLLLVLRLFGRGTGLPLHPLLYFFALVAIAVFFAVKSKFTAATFSIGLLFIELVLGYAGPVTSKLGLDLDLRSFLPRDDFPFVFHPMLGAIPDPNYRTRSVSHSSSSLRNTFPGFDDEKPHVAVFGGSTTYDLGVSSDSKTWVSQLAGRLPKYSFSNNGVPGYSSAEHVVQTAFYVDRAGSLPSCAVYYFGWNDIRNFGFSHLDSGFANFHLLAQYGNLEVRADVNSPSPLVNVLGNFILRAELPFPVLAGELGKPVSEQDALFDIARDNLASILAMNERRGIHTVFVAQILNRSKLTDPSAVYGWLPFVYDSDVWPLQERFNMYVKSFAEENSAGFLYPNIEKFEERDFVDNGHFSDAGAAKFAEIIALDLEGACELNH